MTDSLRFNDGRLEATSPVRYSGPTVSTGTLLVELAQLFARHDRTHLLVTNDSNELVGVVSINDLRTAMRSGNDEAQAWHHRTVESLLSVTFEPDNRQPAAGRDVREELSETECLSVREGADLVALLTSDDLLLSWNRLEETLTRAAIDTLTRLPNRAHFERRFNEEWQRASRLGLSLGLLIIDVDHFKQINDTHGHARGDLVLAAIAQCCQRQLRSYDLVARWAGDEFIALTCGCAPEEIDLPVVRLQSSVAALNLPVDDLPKPTLSIGAAVVTSGLEQIQPHELIQAADHCLYRAKRAGRDAAFRCELRPDGTLSDETRVHATAERAPK